MRWLLLQITCKFEPDVEEHVLLGEYDQHDVLFDKDFSF